MASISVTGVASNELTAPSSAGAAVGDFWLAVRAPALGGLVALPVVRAWWPMGYVQMFGGDIAPVPAYTLHMVWVNWHDSTMFTHSLVLALVLPVLIGLVRVGGWYERPLLVLPVLVTVAAYSAYFVTYLHPRFLYVALPPLFVLDAAGVVAVCGALVGLFVKEHEPPEIAV
jgi:hypothetical protein